MPVIGLSKPTDSPVSAPLAVGALAPNGAPRRALANAPGIVSFLRHPGCPHAELTVRSLERHAPDAVLVLHGELRHARAWLTSIGAAGTLRAVFDADCAHYARWGLGQTNTRHFLGAMPLGSVVRAWASGARNRSATGTRYQRAGAFAVDAAGVIRWLHLPTHAGDLPDIARAVAILGRAP